MSEVKIKLGVNVVVTMNKKQEKYLVTSVGNWGNSGLPANIVLQNMNGNSKLPEFITIQIPKIVTVTEQ